jgi:beta-1,4-N-acetylglucosaminyltransferase
LSIMRSKTTIFVTVGTTLFDALIQAVTTAQALDWMVSNGYTHLVIQYGKGTRPTIDPRNRPLDIEMYDFKSSLEPDMQRADLVMSHAGAGTVMEALRLKKHLVVIINTSLMDNHQTELANALGVRKHLYVVEESKQLEFGTTWTALHDFFPTVYEQGDPYDFPRLLDRVFGFVSKCD